MPHDSKGNILLPGDRVNIPFKVIDVYQFEDACNCLVETTLPMPGTDYVPQLTVNTKQTEKVNEPLISTGEVPEGVPAGLAKGPDGFWTDPTIEIEIIADKQIRVAIDGILQRVKVLPASRERSLVTTKLQEATMWLGMDLKRLGTPNPYPNSKDPSNTIVDPTADGLKL